MSFELTNEAANFYRKALDVKDGEAIRLFVRGGEGFYLGVCKEQPEPQDYQFKRGDITFFMKENDCWFYEDKKLTYIEVIDEVLLYAV